MFYLTQQHFNIKNLLYSSTFFRLASAGSIHFTTAFVSFLILVCFLLKTCLRHPDCESARINKDGVFHRMRLALEQVIEIVTDSRPNGENEVAPISIYTGIKEFKVRMERVLFSAA